MSTLIVGSEDCKIEDIINTISTAPLHQLNTHLSSILLDLEIPKDEVDKIVRRVEIDNIDELKGLSDGLKIWISNEKSDAALSKFCDVLIKYGLYNCASNLDERFVKSTTTGCPIVSQSVKLMDDISQQNLKNNDSDENMSQISTTLNSNGLLEKILVEIIGMKEQFQENQNTMTKQFENINCHSSKITNLQNENEELRNKLRFLEQENELRYRETHFQNLILVGLSDEEYETNARLKEKIYSLFSVCKSIHLNIDTAHRQGRYKKGSRRSVRIRFMSHGDRNLALEYVKRLPDEIYLNEDLPFSVRRDHKLLRQKRTELLRNGEKLRVDWENKAIITNKGKTYVVVDGKFVTKNTAEQNTPHTKRSNSSSSPDSKRCKNDNNATHIVATK